MARSARRWVLLRALLLFLLCLDARAEDRLERFPSRLLGRPVTLALHVPERRVLEAWYHPGPRRLVLFLPGAFDGPEDLLKQGLYADLSRREAAGALAPSLWVAVEHFRSWYADRRDGRFPYERFLLEELLPELERRHPGFGGRREARTVVGLSMGGFGALNLAARSRAFSRCVALSPALVEPPYPQVSWFLRRSLRAAFLSDPEAFAPWNPWKHLGGDAELVLGCGRDDKYGLAFTVQDFADQCAKAGRPVKGPYLRPGGHDWAYWTPAFKELAPWIAGMSEAP